MLGGSGSHGLEKMQSSMNRMLSHENYTPYNSTSSRHALRTKSTRDVAVPKDAVTSLRPALQFRDDTNAEFSRAREAAAGTQSATHERHAWSETAFHPQAKRTRVEDALQHHPPQTPFATDKSVVLSVDSTVSYSLALSPLALTRRCDRACTGETHEARQRSNTSAVVKSAGTTPSTTERGAEFTVEAWHGSSSSSTCNSTAEAPFSPTTALLTNGGATRFPAEEKKTITNSCAATTHASVTTSSASSSSSSAPCSSAFSQRIHQHEVHASDFEYGEVLGEGSYSVVYRATHRASGLCFALKAIHRAHISRLRLEAQLEREVNLQLKLRHPNIVRLYSYFVTSSSIYLVLEYCRGGTLQHRLQAAPHGRLSEATTSRYARHVARALTHLHSRGIAHRDLKLENVLVDQDDVAKLADFGWSRPVCVPYTNTKGAEAATDATAAAAAAAVSKLTKEVGGVAPNAPAQTKSHPHHHAATALVPESTTNAWTDEVDAEAEVVEGRRTVCGTLDYLSPEMVSGHTHSFQTDVWSLGVMVAEMLTGVPPFFKDSPQQTLHAIRCEAPNLGVPFPEHKPATPLGERQISAGLPGDERDLATPQLVLSASALSLIGAMLQKDPAKRPSMDAVLAHPWLRKPTHDAH